MNSSFSPAQVANELLGARTKIAACGIPAADVVGFRQPYLESNPTVRQAREAGRAVVALVRGQGLVEGPPRHPATPVQGAPSRHSCAPPRPAPPRPAACRPSPPTPPAAPSALQVLRDNGFLYDSTILEEVHASLSDGMAARVWPYTLQDGVPQNCAWCGCAARCRIAAAPALHSGSCQRCTAVRPAGPGQPAACGRQPPHPHCCPCAML